MKTHTYSNIIFILVLFLNYNHIYSDIPAECKFSEIKGKWEFYISNKSFDPNLLNPETACGHSIPNEIEYIIGNKDNYPNNYNKHITLDLSPEHNVIEKGNIVGDWTPIYLQGFLINYKQSIFNTNFKYFLDEKDEHKFITDCTKTSLGWYIPDKNNKHKNWHCFYARKVYAHNSFLKQISKSLLEIKSNKIVPNKQILFTTKYDDLANKVKIINEANLTWKAQMNPNFMGKSLYQVKKHLGLNKGVDRISDNEYQQYLKNHQNTQILYNQVNNNNNKDNKINQINSISSINNIRNNVNIPISVLTQIKVKKIKKNEEIDSEFVTNKEDVLKYLNTKIEDIDANKLPRNWDWRNVGGMNFIPEPREQGDCGSCYTIATIEAIESRLRIKTYNQDQTQFSINFPLKCNFYSEGCDGGYPIMVGKFFNEFEIIPTNCFKDKCINKCKNNKKYVVGKYGYIGKFYPGTNEIDMMKELRARGPIMGSLIVKNDFIHYKSGIYSTKPLFKNSDYISNTSLFDDNIEYVKVEHSVLIVGYGEENGVKYWICLNSWGNSFGEDGFFKILRGENDSNIESMAEFITVDVYDNL